jgi:hypothetical protein
VFGVPKSVRIPEHKSLEHMNKSTRVAKSKETKNLLKSAHVSKVVHLSTRALAPPFIGRQRDFYIPKLPLNLKNISSVNMYMNVFYIS